MSTDGEKVESFDKLTIRNSTMYGMYEYEAVNTGSRIEIGYYIVYFGNERPRKLLQEASCDTRSFFDILDRCGILKWHGFHGERPEGLLDGVTFQIEASVNGRNIYADGSENFPGGYHDLMNEIYRMLRESEESARD